MLKLILALDLIGVGIGVGVGAGVLGWASWRIDWRFAFGRSRADPRGRRRIWPLPPPSRPSPWRRSPRATSPPTPESDGALLLDLDLRRSPRSMPPPDHLGLPLALRLRRPMRFACATSTSMRDCASIPAPLWHPTPRGGVPCARSVLEHCAASPARALVRAHDGLELLRRLVDEHADGVLVLLRPLRNSRLLRRRVLERPGEVLGSAASVILTLRIWMPYG